MTQLARLLALAADDAEARGSPFTGVMRRAARALLDVPHRAGTGGCRGCGGTLAGRQRTWCSEACRRRHRP